MYKIISDGGCDFRGAEAQSIDIVPFYISFDGATHMREGIDISTADYFEKLIADKSLRPKTAQPSPQDYIDVFTPHLEAGHDILAVTISSRLSGSYNSATLAADMLNEDFPNRTIKIVDSQNASIGQGLILREIIRMQKAGYNLQKNVAIAQKILKSTQLYFTLDTLEYLKRGGRVGPTTALVGGILGLRPILQLVEGEISQLDSVRGKKNALRLIREGLVAALESETENINLTIGHIHSENEATGFKTDIEAALDLKLTGPVTEVGAAIGTHAGPGALAFAYCRKFEAFAAEFAEELAATAAA